MVQGLRFWCALQSRTRSALSQQKFRRPSAMAQRSQQRRPNLFFRTLFFVAQTQMMAGSAGPSSNSPAAARLPTLIVVVAVALVSTVALPMRSRVVVVTDIFVPGASSSLSSFALPPPRSHLSASSRRRWRYGIEGGHGPPLVGAGTSPTQRRVLVQEEDEEEEHRRTVKWGRQRRRWW